MAPDNSENPDYGADEVEFTFMEHPDVKGDPVRVPKAAIDELWKSKGWREVSKTKAKELASEGVV